MIKIFIHLTKLVIAALTALLFASCNFNFNSIEGSGIITTEKRNVDKNFTAVKVSNGIDLVIEQAAKVEVTVEADDNLQSEIETTVSNGMLRVSCKSNVTFGSDVKKVIVKMPVITELLASSAGTVRNIGTIESESITLETSSASNMKLTLEAEQITTSASSGSSQDLNGKALKLIAKTSSGSSINAQKLFVNDTEARASSGSTLNVHPALALSAHASSGASVNYFKMPLKLEKISSSGGSVSLN